MRAPTSAATGTRLASAGSTAEPATPEPDETGSSACERPSPPESRSNSAGVGLSNANVVSRSANAKPVEATSTNTATTANSSISSINANAATSPTTIPTCTAKRPTANTSSAAKWVVRAISTSSAQVSTSNNTELSDAMKNTIVMLSCPTSAINTNANAHTDMAIRYSTPRLRLVRDTKAPYTKNTNAASAMVPAISAGFENTLGATEPKYTRNPPYANNAAISPASTRHDNAVRTRSRISPRARRRVSASGTRSAFQSRRLAVAATAAAKGNSDTATGASVGPSSMIAPCSKAAPRNVMDVNSTARRASRSRYITPHAKTMGVQANPVANAPTPMTAGKAENAGSAYRQVPTSAVTPHASSTDRTRPAAHPITERQFNAHAANITMAVADDTMCTIEIARPSPPTISRELNDKNTQA